jgi:hypothetical protein
VALAVFVKSSEKEIPARERAIAEIARAVHDFFLFQVLGTAAALNYDALAARIIGALKLRPGERVLMRFDAGYFSELVEPLGRRIREAGAVDLGGNPRPQEFEQRLEATDVYVASFARSVAHRAGSARAATMVGQRAPVARSTTGRKAACPDRLPGEHRRLSMPFMSALDIDYAAFGAQDGLSLCNPARCVRTPAGQT